MSDTGKPVRGRPKAFQEAVALAAARDLFARQGYATTSLDALTGAMGINRSSFYASFESKHAVLLRALEDYCVRQYADFEAAVDGADDPRAGAWAMVTAIANAQGGRHGCFAVNCVGELAPSDPAVDALLKRHMNASEALLADTLARAGVSEPARRARAALALALGTITLRKAGLPRAQIDATVSDGLDALFRTDAVSDQEEE